MATFTTKITPGKIEQELTFNGGVYRRTYRRISGEWVADTPELQYQVAQRYPNIERLQGNLVWYLEMAGGFRRVHLLAELQAIEDEYAKAKEAQNETAI